MGDHADWIIGQGSTDAAFHVPSADHTLGTSQGEKVFICVYTHVCVREKVMKKKI